MTPAARARLRARQRRVLIFLQACGLLGASSTLTDIALSWGLGGRRGRPCPGHRRHFFTVYGAVGTRSPTCVRCGAPRPANHRADVIVRQVAAQWRARHLESKSMPRAFAGPR